MTVSGDFSCLGMFSIVIVGSVVISLLIACSAVISGEDTDLIVVF